MKVEPCDTVHGLASEGYKWFESFTRPSDPETTLYRVKDGAPEWLGELVRSAHGDFLPDDWRFECIMDALEAIGDAGEDAELEDVETEFADSGDVYTSELLAWLGSNASRVAYCDQAISDGLAEPDTSITQRIMLGQYEERREVFASVRASLEALADE